MLGHRCLGHMGEPCKDLTWKHAFPKLVMLRMLARNAFLNLVMLRMLAWPHLRTRLSQAGDAGDVESPVKSPLEIRLSKSW